VGIDRRLGRRLQAFQLPWAGHVHPARVHKRDGTAANMCGWGSKELSSNQCCGSGSVILLWRIRFRIFTIYQICEKFWEKSSTFYAYLPQ
jgi:hypothetical protein